MSSIPTIVLDVNSEIPGVHPMWLCWVCGDPIHPRSEQNYVREQTTYHLQSICLNCPESSYGEYVIEVRVRFPHEQRGWS